MVTAATLHKAKLFHDGQRLTLLHDQLLDTLEEFGWSLQAWAVFPNHYHLVAQSPVQSVKFEPVARALHSKTAIALNKLDGASGRQVWFNYWDKALTYPRSYYARLAYVHRNAVKHGLVTDPVAYPYCSARWFEQNADRALFNTVQSFRSDSINEPDDY